MVHKIYMVHISCFITFLCHSHSVRTGGPLLLCTCFYSIILAYSHLRVISQKCPIFPVYFPDVPLTRKIHELAFDVPHFVKEHKTVGLFSEE